MISPPTLARAKANPDIKGLWVRSYEDRVETAWRFGSQAAVETPWQRWLTVLPCSAGLGLVSLAAR